MITAIARTEMEENIQACCKSLFLTSAIPEFIKEDGTPKQTYKPVASPCFLLPRSRSSSRKTARRSRSNILRLPSEKKLSAGTRTSANVWSNAPGSRFIKRSTDMNTAV